MTTCLPTRRPHSLLHTSIIRQAIHQMKGQPATILQFKKNCDVYFDRSCSRKSKVKKTIQVEFRMSLGEVMEVQAVPHGVSQLR